MLLSTKFFVTIRNYRTSCPFRIPIGLIRFCCLLDFGSPGSQVKLPNCRANKVVFWQATCTASDGSPFRISFLSILELDKKEEFLIDPNRNSINASICSFLDAPDLQKILTDHSAQSKVTQDGVR